MIEFIIGILLNGCVLIFAPPKKLLTRGGALTAFIIGLMFYFIGSFFSWFLLILFFLSSSIIGKIKQKYHLSTPVMNVTEEKKGRKSIQVIANSVPALICLILFGLTQKELFHLAMGATIAGATADTWASEIGILSHQKPVSVLSFKPVDTGLSGGVTFLGSIASVLGAGFIALWYVFFFYNYAQSSHQLLLFLLIIIFSGTLGSFIDSVLGESIQEKYLTENSEITEIKSRNKQQRLHSGIKGIDNNLVNLLTGFLTAIVSILFGYWLV